MSKSEIHSLTGLRGLAALYVMIFHFHSYVANEDSIGQHIISHGYIAVDLFFVLSGFVMAITYGSWFGASWAWRRYLVFLARRLGRIYPLFFCATIVTLVVSRFNGQYNPNNLNVNTTTLTENLLMIQGWGLNISIDVPGWSISTEWAAYLLFPIMILIILRAQWLVGVALGSVCIALLAWMAQTSMPECPWRRGPLDLTEVGNVIPLVRCLTEFILGILTYKIYLRPNFREFFSRHNLSTIIFTVLIGMLYWNSFDFGIVITIPVLILSLSNDTGVIARILSNKLFQFLGILSYSIYLIHVPFFYFSGSYLTEIFPENWPIVFYAGSIAVATATYLCIERPARKWARRGEAFILAPDKDAESAILARG